MTAIAPAAALRTAADDPFGHPHVRWVERQDDPTDAVTAWAVWAALPAADRSRLRHACASRRAEFAAARWCARDALTALGLPGTAPARGDDGAPQWPHGVVGSITHSGRFRAAAVALASDCAGVGVDIEPDLALPPGVAPYVLRAEEVTALRADEVTALRADGVAAPDGSSGTPVHVDRLLFCVKEAVYKIWSPLNPTARVRPGFHDVSVTINSDGTFRALLDPRLAGRCPAELPGRWVSAGGLLRVLAVVPAERGTTSARCVPDVLWPATRQHTLTASPYS